MGMPNVLKHFATFIDGTSYVGEVQEITPPKLTRKMEEFGYLSEDGERLREFTVPTIETVQGWIDNAN